MGIGVVLPWAVRNWVVSDTFGMVSPKTQVNRALAAWFNGVADGNDTALLSYDEWNDLRLADDKSPLSDYAFWYRVLDAETRRHAPANGDGPPAWLTVHQFEATARSLVDEGIATAAEFGVFSPDGAWLIEGHGVDPDVVVDNPPHATFHGKDAQLDRAVALLQQLIKDDPRPLPPVPRHPTPARSKGGIETPPPAPAGGGR